MKKLISSVVLTSILLSSFQVHADESAQKTGVISMVQALEPEKPKSEKDVGAALSPMKKGQFSPFTGVLLSPLAIATLISELNAKGEEIKIEVDRAKAEAEANHTYEKSVMTAQCVADKKVLQANVDAKNQQIESFDAAVKAELESRPNPAFWAVLGAVAGVVVTTAAASAIVAVAK
jgi:hypothetical protein